MRILKKITSCFLAGVLAFTMMCAFTVSVGAADYKKVVTSTGSVNRYYSLGKDLYFSQDHKIYRITDKNIKNLKKTGKLSRTKVTLPKELSGNDWTFYNDNDFNYAPLCLFVKDNGQCVICRYDDEKNSLIKVYSSSNPCGISKNGVISEFQQDSKNGKLTLKLISKTGKTIKSVSINCIGSAFRVACYGSKYCYAICAYSTDSLVYPDGNPVNHFKGNLIRIDEKGNQKVLDELAFEWLSIEKCTQNGFSFKYSFAGGTYEYNYFNDTGELSGVLDFLGRGTLYGDKVYGNRAIMKHGDSDNAYYTITDVKTEMAISGKYKSMSTNDGKIYLVQNYDGKWGYIDSKGKELGWFDDATLFSGSYALVIKNGKTYFINKNMKRVSETFKSDEVICTGKLFQYKSGDKWYSVTMK
ncbi:MAG: WG repeat-containing protein [Ruminiclostridium sp.]